MWVWVSFRVRTQAVCGVWDRLLHLCCLCFHFLLHHHFPTIRLPLSSPLYICFHNTLQIAGFNNVSLEVLLYAFGASIIEAQHCCSLLIMGVLVCLLLLVRCFMGMLSLWLLQDMQLFHEWPECITAGSEFSPHELGRFSCPWGNFSHHTEITSLQGSAQKGHISHRITARKQSPSWKGWSWLGLEPGLNGVWTTFETCLNHIWTIFEPCLNQVSPAAAAQMKCWLSVLPASLVALDN